MKKQKKHFYHSIVSIQSVMIELEKFDFSQEERDELAELAERTLHHSILDLVLSELSDKDKHLFLQHHASENHEKVWSLLNEKVQGIEEKIKKTADVVSEKLHNDLNKTK